MFFSTSSRYHGNSDPMALSISTLFISACFLLILPDVTNIVLAADGKWSQWWEWQPCSATCGKGTRQRFRLCNNPPRSEGGADCVGKDIEKEACQAPIECPVHGGWNDWSLWTQCSVTCGEGVKIRRRECNSPPPANGGRDCEDSNEERIKCVSAEECPRDGKWSSWGQWSPCSVTCGENGSMSRYRACNNPPPSPDGKTCPGPNKQTRKCKKPPCPVNGHWSKWAEWSSCSVTCGTGVRTRWRKCDNPPPQNGGLDCSREDAAETQEISCNGSFVFCPVNGGWSDWGKWGECNSPSCGSPKALSYVMRERSCNNPYPAHRGSMCQGTFLSAALCEKPVNCPVDGQWSEWSEWKCTKTAATRLRKCDNPEPANGGKQCLGEKVETFLNDEEQYGELCPDLPAGSDEDGAENENSENSGDGEKENEENEEFYEDDYVEQ